MSHLILQQNELLNRFNEDTSLFDLIQFFESEYSQRGEVICRVKINNMILNEEEELIWGSTKLDSITSFEVETENAQKLLKDVIQKWVEDLPQLIEASDYTSNQIRFEGVEKSYTTFSNFIDSCHLLVSSLSSIRTIMESKLNFITEDWKALEKKLWTSFSELMNACSSKESQLIADIIEYDLADTLLSWYHLLKKLQNE